MAEQQLKKVLGGGFSVAACIGIIIGLGIFRLPGEIAATISNPQAYMALWIVGGLFTLLLVAFVGELMAETPKSGGMYPLIAHAYSPYPGFVIGWVDYMSGPAVMALKTVVLVEYLSLLMPALAEFSLLAALVITTFFACLQLGGVRMGGNIHQAAVVVMGLMMIALIVALFVGNADRISEAPETDTTSAGTSLNFAGFGLVVSSAIFVYNGWIMPSVFGGEFKAGGREIVRGAIRGTLIVTVVYLLLNAALVTSVPLEYLGEQELALARAIELLYGDGTPIVLLAIFVLLIHQNLNYMGFPRTLYALSVDGLGYRRATTVAETGTPVGALLITWGMTVLLIVVGSFQVLLSLTSMMFMVQYLAAILGVYLLRRMEPDAERPYRAWGYPFTGYICLGGYAFLTLIVAVTEPRSTLYALGVVALSAPVYLWLKSKHHLAAAT